MPKQTPEAYQDPDQLRAYLRSINAMARMAGQELSDEDIETIIYLHCTEGYSLEKCLEKMINAH